MNQLRLALGGILLTLGTVAFFCQGPIATIFIGIAWAIRLRGRPDHSDITSLSPESSEESTEQQDEPSALREGAYFVGLVVASLAVLLDWICLIQFVTKDGSTSAKTLEQMSNAIPIVAGIAFVIALTGRGAGRIYTALTSSLIAIGSIGLIVLEGCQHISY
ncbi:MAG: hypothetical protein JST28_22965 [Acidobacteria bacterium]|nr:hypothetical protein [Acidobacteriota bacterium]